MLFSKVLNHGCSVMLRIVPKWLLTLGGNTLQTRKMKDVRSDLCKVSRLAAQRRSGLFYPRAGSLEDWPGPSKSWAAGSLWWVDLGWQLSPIQLLTRFLPRQDRIGRAKVRKLGSWDKDSLIDEAKLHIQAKQQEELIHYSLSAGRRPAASWEAGPRHL